MWKPFTVRTWEIFISKDPKRNVYIRIMRSAHQQNIPGTETRYRKTSSHCVSYVPVTQGKCEHAAHQTSLLPSTNSKPVRIIVWCIRHPVHVSPGTGSILSCMMYHTASLPYHFLSMSRDQCRTVLSTLIHMTAEAKETLDFSGILATAIDFFISMLLGWQRYLIM